MNFSTTSQAAYEREKERLMEVDNRNDFLRRYYPLYLSLRLAVYPISVILCIALTSAHLYVNGITMINVAWIVGLLTFLAAALFEVWKSGSSNAFFDGIRAGDYHPTGKKFWAWFLSLVGFLATFGGGVYFDFKGAPIVTEYVKSRQQPIATKLTDLAPINAHYDAKIADVNARQDQALGTKWKGNITREAVKLSNQFEKTKQTIEAQRDSSIADARLVNAGVQQGYGTETANTSFWLRGLIIFFLLGQLVYFAFNSVYNDVGKEELRAIISGAANNSSTPTPAAEPSSSSPTGSPDMDMLATMLAEKLGLNKANLSMMSNAETQHQPPQLNNEIGFTSVKKLHQQLSDTQPIPIPIPIPTPTPSLTVTSKIAAAATADEALQPVATSCNPEKETERNLDIGTYHKAWQHVFKKYQAWCNKWKLNYKMDTKKMWVCYEELHEYMVKLHGLGVDVKVYEERIAAYGSDWKYSRPDNIRNIPRVGQQFKDYNGLILQCVRYALANCKNDADAHDQYGSADYDFIAKQPSDSIFIIAAEPHTPAQTGWMPLEMVRECITEKMEG